MKIVDIIKYEGDNSTFIWKHPNENFNTLSQLIVHESQEALLFLNGQALDLFGPGKHTLHTSNIPLLNKIVNLPTSGESPFHCEVYFINKTEQMAINWGMGNVNFLDPTHNNYAFKIGASGEMSLRISDSRKIITKLVGTETVLDQETIKKFFKAPITTHIKTMLLYGNISIALGVTFIVIGVVLWWKMGSVKEAKSAVEDARVDVLKSYDDRDKHKKEFETDVEKMRQEITDLEGRISGLEGKTADCRRYIDLGEDKIAELLFAKECNAFGVSKSFDSHIQTMRELAFEERAEE